MKKTRKKRSEKRKSQRLKIPLRLEYKRLRGKGKAEKTIAHDVSGSGLGIRLEEPLKKGDKLKILLHFANDPKPVTLTSEVVWHKKTGKGKKVFYDTGIRHVKVPVKDRERFIFLFCEMMINFLTLGKNP